MIRSLLILAIVVTGLSGCAWFGDKDNSEPPLELQAFDEQVRLRALWSRDTGSGTDEQNVNLVPAVILDRVYAADRDGAVWAYRLDDGNTLWEVKTANRLSAGPGVAEGLVVVGTSDGEVIALAEEDGQEMWRVAASSEVLSIPRIHQDVVVIQTVDGALAGFDATNGQRLWISDRDVPVLTLRGSSSPLIIDNVVLAGFANGKMVAVDIRSGGKLWEIPIAIPQGRSELERIVDLDVDAVIRDTRLYVASFQGNLKAVDLTTGREDWSREISAYAGIAVDYSQVYVSDADSEVWAFDSSGGTALWKQSGLLRRAVTGPVVIEGYIAVGDYQGYLHLLSRYDGSLVGRIRVDGEGIRAPAYAAGDRLLVMGAGGKLVLYQVESIGDR
jgi:outer membrane protein assembly factor BamB